MPALFYAQQSSRLVSSKIGLRVDSVLGCLTIHRYFNAPSKPNITSFTVVILNMSFVQISAYLLLAFVHGARFYISALFLVVE